MFLEDIDFCTYPIYFNDPIFLDPGYAIKLRIAKSIFGNEFEKVINEYINRALEFANEKVAFEKIIDEHGITKLREKMPFVIHDPEMRNPRKEVITIDEEAIELLDKIRKLSSIADEYTPFMVCEKKFETFIEKHLEIDIKIT